MPTLRSLSTGASCSIVDQPIVIARTKADLNLDDIACDSANHFSIQPIAGGYELVADHLVHINGNEVHGRMRLHLGDKISVGSNLLVFEHEPTTADCTVHLNQWRNSTPAATVPSQAIELPRGMKLILGREKSPKVTQLNHPLVSRFHAEITRQGTQITIRDLGSSNGTFVNGERLRQAVSLKPNDVIGIGPFSLRLNGVVLECATKLQNAQPSELLATRLACEKLARCLPDQSTYLLKNISLTIQPGEFACIVGPSGAGKSTLLKALANREPVCSNLVRSGEVEINDVDLRANFEQLKRHIAYVPQNEILYENLALEDALRYTASLRLPSDASQAEIKDRIDKILSTVRLERNRRSLIKNLSGGERKRACLANEMLAEPGLLFLDEVTSGLDEQTDGEIMALFRELASAGRTIVCITHSLSHVMENCNRVILLTRFGRLAFSGTPNEALQYFQIDKLRDAYTQLAVSTVAEADALEARFNSWQAQTANCPNSTADKSTTDKRSSGHVISNHSAYTAPARTSTSAWREFNATQFWVLLKRYAHVSSVETRANVLRLAQCLIVAGLVFSVFGTLSEANAPTRSSAAFILVLSCFWFGCNNSAKEIVREQAVYDQESRIVVRPINYMLSKLSLLSGISCLQGLLLLVVMARLSDLPGDPISWAIIVFLTSIAGVCVGLLISAQARSEEAAIATVPIVLIPQIILSGALVDLADLNDRLASLMITSYWSLDLANCLLEESDWTHFDCLQGALAICLQSIVGFALAFVTLQRKSV